MLPSLMQLMAAVWSCIFLPLLPSLLVSNALLLLLLLSFQSVWVWIVSRRDLFLLKLKYELLDSSGLIELYSPCLPKAAAGICRQISVAMQTFRCSAFDQPIESKFE